MCFSDGEEGICVLFVLKSVSERLHHHHAVLLAHMADVLAVSLQLRFSLVHSLIVVTCSVFFDVEKLKFILV